MSETRRTRQQLRQSLVQHTFHYYEELTRTQSASDAKRQVREVAEEALAPFTGGPLGGPLFTVLKDWESEWLEKEKVAREQKDVDTQYLAADVLDALWILTPLAKEKEDAENGD